MSGDRIRRISVARAGGGLLLSVLCATLTHARPPVVGERAPDFEATTFDGQKLRLADFRGQVLVINLWATWCVPCRTELPLLDGYLRARRDYGLRVVALATENSVPDNQLRPLAGKLAIPFLRRMNGAYTVLQGVPTNYIIDRAGVVRYAKAGGLTLQAMNELLVPLLSEPAPDSDAIAAPVTNDTE